MVVAVFYPDDAGFGWQLFVAVQESLRHKIISKKDQYDKCYTRGFSRHFR